MKNDILIQRYFEEHSLIASNIQSFDNFIEKGMQEIVKEMQEVVPTIIPQDIEDFRIRLDKIWVEKPNLVEADGSKRNIMPIEARLRNLTYSAPIFLEVSAHINGVQKESFTTQIGKLPIMLKSKYCHLHGMKKDELVANGEDPHDPGGYFILNGNERVLITVEDLASNKLFAEQPSSGTAKYIGRIFSEKGSYRIPHLIEQMKDGIINLTFTRFTRIPVIVLIKALGITKDVEIVKYIGKGQQYDDIYINLYDSVHLKTQQDALDYIAKKAGMVGQAEEDYLKVLDNLDKYLLPHIGTTQHDRVFKAYSLCKLLRRFLITTKTDIEGQDKDHYMNKRLKLSGDLLADLFRVNMRALVNDILYNFQRLVKRGKFSSVKIIIRDKLLTSRVKSAMATGTWVGGRKGISQNIDRTNFLATLSHLQRVVSLLSSSQENFEARSLHPTNYSRLCPIETPEGTPIGLRKNLAMLASVSQEEYSEDKVKKVLEGLGMKHD
ncbi:MAG TPA: DNA-directed RNA polymerase subunit B'' [Candidatus Nanoarchaeia archaeon]|nr:DNA-directed RNA polymerase subunit B'' [Candidatus Nanoarchaeia archaeon]